MIQYTDRRAAVVRSPADRIRVTRVRSWDPLPLWQADLDRIAPPATAVSSLRFLWEPGDDWSPIERWCIWQVYPEGIVPLLVQDAMRGPSPRSTGHACAPGLCLCDVKANRWVGGPPESFGVDLRGWELYRETGRFHRRWWVVQGEHGGHRTHFDEIESTISRAYGGPDQPPTFGDLPYAEPDARTWNLIGQSDLLRQYRDATDFVSRPAESYTREERDRATAAQEAVWGWLDAQLHGPADRLAFAIKHSDSTLVPRAAPWDASTALDPDTTKHAFLENAPHAPLAA